MTMQEEGYIKFNCKWERKEITFQEKQLEGLNFWREKFAALSLIGIYDDGIGYGNLSVRERGNVFLISGSATGGKKQLALSDYARVTAFNVENNTIFCEGQTKASSESLSHAAIYDCLPGIDSVIHVHSAKMWRHFFELLPTTSKQISYGTPQMAEAIQKIVVETNDLSIGAVVMGGHEDGIIVYGSGIDVCGEYLLALYYQSLNNSAIS